MDIIIAAIRRVAELQQAVAAIDAIFDRKLHNNPRNKVEVTAFLGDTGSERYCVNVRMTPSDICHALNRTRASLLQELSPLLKVLERAERDLEDKQ